MNEIIINCNIPRYVKKLRDILPKVTVVVVVVGGGVSCWIT